MFVVAPNQRTTKVCNWLCLYTHGRKANCIRFG